MLVRQAKVPEFNPQHPCKFLLPALREEEKVDSWDSLGSGQNHESQVSVRALLQYKEDGVQEMTLKADLWPLNVPYTSIGQEWGMG